MPRSARIIAPQCLYHIICRGNNQQMIFRESPDFVRYLTLIAKYKAQHPFSLYHYVLMGNHVHMLIEPSSSNTLAKAMLKINLAYSHYFQKKYGGVGHLWQGRYKSILVAKDNYCLACATYIELNPVAAHLVERPEDYPWSSYPFYALGQTNHLLTPNPLFETLGLNEAVRRTNYQFLVQQAWDQKQFQEEEMDRMRYYGASQFVQQMEATTGIPNISTRGRPKKSASDTTSTTST